MVEICDGFQWFSHIVGIVFSYHKPDPDLRGAICSLRYIIEHGNIAIENDPCIND